MESGPDPLPRWIFQGARPLSDPLVLDGVLTHHLFRDGVVTGEGAQASSITLRIGHVFFADTGLHDAHGTRGAMLRLVLDGRAPDPDLFRIGDLLGRAVDAVTFDPLALRAHLHIQDLCDLSVAIDPAASTYEWLFKPRLI